MKYLCLVYLEQGKLHAVADRECMACGDGLRQSGLLVAAEALRQGFTVERINEIAGFDPWFLKRLAEIVEAEEEVRINGLPSDSRGMRRLKAMGFSDARLAQLSLRSAGVERGMSEAVAAAGSGVVHSAMAAMTGGITEGEVRSHRMRLAITSTTTTGP